MVKLITTSTYFGTIKAIAKLLEKNENRKAIVFCEDKFTLMAESEILKYQAGKGSINIEVSTLSRFLLKNTVKRCNLSKQGSTMVIKRVLLSDRDKIDCFKNSCEYKNTAQSLFELISQLKSAKVEFNDLENASEQSSGILAEKLKDIAFIYKKYEEFLADKYYDENNFLSLLPEIIANSEKIKNADIYLVGFDSFTRQGREVVKSLMKTGRNLTAVFCGEDEKQSEVYTNESIDAVLNIAKAENIAIDIIKFNENLNGESLHIIKKLYSSTAYDNKDALDTKNISIFEATSISDEVSFALRNINMFVKSRGYRYRDIAIVAGDLSKYESELIKGLKDYDLPYFLDRKKKLSSSILVQFILNLLNIVKNNYDKFDVISLVKNPLLNDNFETQNIFENYMIKYGINRKKFFNEIPDDLTSEVLRNQVLELTAPFKKKDLASNYVKILLDIFEKLKISEKLENYALKLKEIDLIEESSFTLQVFDKVVSSLEEISEILDNTKINIKEFKGILESGFESDEISILPLSKDSIYISDIISGGIKPCNLLIAIGIDDNVPTRKSDTALLSDRDISVLEKLNLNIEPKIKFVNYRNREKCVLSLASFSKRLILSYSTQGFLGKEKKPSEIILELQNIFSINQKPLPVISSLKQRLLFSEMTREAQDRFYLSYYSSKKAGEKHFSEKIEESRYRTFDFRGESAFYLAEKEIYEDTSLLDGFMRMLSLEDKDFLEKNLLPSKKYISSSEVENYFNCPYKHFLNYTLGIKEQEIGIMQARDNGVYLHQVIEEFTDKGLKTDSLEARESLILKICDEVSKTPPYDRLFYNPFGMVLKDIIRREAVRVCNTIYDELQVSEFKPIGSEIEFNSVKSSIEVSSLKGQLAIGGKIDRADKWQNYLRIIDYKTGSFSESPIVDLYFGSHIQLFLYMTAIVANGKYKPAGVYYFPVEDSFNATEENPLQLNGITLKDIEIVKKMDRDIEKNGKSKFIDIKLKNTNGLDFDNRQKRSFDELEFKALLDYSTAVAKSAVKEIEEGIIAKLPMPTECAYCKFKGVCRKDEDRERAKISGVDIEMIKECVTKPEEE